MFLLIKRRIHVHIDIDLPIRTTNAMRNSSKTDKTLEQSRNPTAKFQMSYTGRFREVCFPDPKALTVPAVLMRQKQYGKSSKTPFRHRRNH